MDKAEQFFRRILTSDLEQYADDPRNEIYKTARLKLELLDGIEAGPLRQKFVLLGLLDFWSIQKDVVDSYSDAIAYYCRESLASMWEADDMLKSMGHDPLGELDSSGD